METKRADGTAGAPPDRTGAAGAAGVTPNGTGERTVGRTPDGPGAAGRAGAAVDVTAAASADPEVGLRAVAALRVLAERLEILQVDNARRLGWSWQDIAERLGVTKQTVHRKHGGRFRGQRR